MELDKEVTTELCQNLYDNRNQNSCCDFLLISNDDKQLPVHKAVLLSSKSTHLQLLTRNHLDEQNCHLPISFSQLEIIVKYLYTGEVSVTEFSAIKDLYENAEKLQLPFLQEYSTTKLLAGLTLDCCLEYLRHSWEFSIGKLQEKCLELIADNTEEFFNKFLNDLTEDELKEILIVREKLKIEEIELYRNIKKWIIMKNQKRNYYIEEILLKKIDFCAIPFNIFQNEIDTLDNELRRNYSALEKFLWVNNEKEKSIFKKKLNENYSPIIDQENLYCCFKWDMKIVKINIEEQSSDLEYENEQYRDMYGYGKCNFKCDNMDYVLFSGGVHQRTKSLHKNLFWSPGKIESDGSLMEFPSLLQPRYFHESIFFDDKIYICGGRTGVCLPTKSCEIFNFGPEKWYNGPDCVDEKLNFCLTALGNCLYAIYSNLKTSYVEFLDPRVDLWNRVGGQNIKRCVRSFPVSESSILCLTETNEPSFIFDTRNNKFSEAVEYNNSPDNFNMIDVFKFNSDIYGTYIYKNRPRREICFSKLGMNYQDNWKVVKLDNPRGWTFHTING